MAAQWNANAGLIATPSVGTAIRHQDRLIHVSILSHCFESGASLNRDNEGLFLHFSCFKNLWTVN